MPLRDEAVKGIETQFVENRSVAKTFAQLRVVRCARVNCRQHLTESSGYCMIGLAIEQATLPNDVFARDRFHREQEIVAILKQQLGHQPRWRAVLQGVEHVALAPDSFRLAEPGGCGAELGSR